MHEGDIIMSKQDQFTYRIIEDFRTGQISREKAAALLEVTERTITRKAAKIRCRGLVGVKHGNTARRPSNKTSDDLKTKVLELIRSTYFDFNVTHLRETLEQRENIHVSYSVLLRLCHENGLIKHRKKRRANRKRLYRERMTNEGLLVQMDGSHHEWNGKDKWCLIGQIDDATSEIAHAQFFENEGTWSCMESFQGLLLKKGIPEAVYVDRASWFGGQEEQHFSQFKRAVEEIGSRIIYANSPEAKGRIERAWQTFQDRLIPEMRLNGITTILQANWYLLTVFLPQYWNQRNTVAPLYSSSRYKPLPRGCELGEIFCIKEYRRVRRDHTFSFDGKEYKIVDPPADLFLAGGQIQIRIKQDQSWRAYFYRQVLWTQEIHRPRLWTKVS